MSPDKTQQHDGHRQRLRARYAQGGITALADYEIVEYLLTLLIPRIDVKPIAKELSARYPTLSDMLNARPEELVKIRGLGESAATSISFLKDLLVRCNADELSMPSDKLTTVSKLMKYFRSKIAALSNEVFEVVCLDAKLQMIPNGALRISEGVVTRTSVDNRKVIEFAIKRGAASIAVAHNHPSGDPSPSLDDIILTRKLSEACKPIRLNLIEHIIVGKRRCYSFRRDGQFDCLYDDTLEDQRISTPAPRQEKRKIAQ